ncbi:lysylphosphatidylglycerol synthase domain-containing protein [Fulvivirgaceae bacterium BMA10]|uniref:Lysylphosphatidylglycerol synthase domain-containing protein n=1 Tax=Splendidivirga corallicola TaxID=3051826 RepID=A0ABT8KQA2_9BACT|nr:lysylphosphatidylglycerol synthase domain-containing protein [Fulvivirgaceae bacterium BMA10]
MQYRYISIFKKNNGRTAISILLKLTILIGIIYYFLTRFNNDEGLSHDITETLNFWLRDQSILIHLVLLILMCINWTIEAIKWKFLVRKNEIISVTQAIKGVLCGLCIGLITPWRIGDYAGRIWQLQNDTRKEMIGAVALNQFIQTMVTYIFGMVGLGWFIKNFYGFDTASALMIITIVLSLFLLLTGLLLKGRGSIVRFIHRVLGRGVGRMLHVISSYSRKDIHIVFALSAIRYLVFATQFLLVLKFFELALPIHILFAGITWVFLIKSVIPAINFLSDLGARGVSALIFFNFYHVDTAIVISATLVVWLINILIPALIGLFFTFRMRIFRK